ncbi:MAG: ABC-F family ATP-binding cassette domain-containing protein [Anaerolineales bacterium]
MSLLQVTGLAKAYGGRDLFRNVTFDLPPRARYGLIGPNGCGKTTLLRILIGEEEASAGEIRRARNLRLGYLPQEADFHSDQSLWEFARRALADLLAQQEELHRLEEAMARAPDPALFERYARLQESFERRGGYTWEARIRYVLDGLGFREEEYHLPLDHLSGGQRTRAGLAYLLLSEPDVLLLDEPTNHLDVTAVEWLEGYLLSRWEGAAIIVSHDRYFLDQTCQAILELSPQGLTFYRGNYSAYLRQRQEHLAREEELFTRERERLLKEIDYIKRNIAGQNVQQAKGRLRRLTRHLQAIEQVGLEEALTRNWSQLDVDTTTSVFSVEEAERRVRDLRPPRRPEAQLRLQLRAPQRSGDLVLRTRNLRVGYAERPLFTVPDLVLRRGECVALIGPNGAGKTTFLKTILGEIPPLSGEVMLGASLQVGYFAQAHEGLNPSRTVLEEVLSVAPHMLPGEARHYLAKYLFTDEDVFKRVAMLSGGERSRLALAKLALQQANLLLLDEPTNHLDIPSQEVLQNVLAAYEGTILLVSHDRYLIDALATQIWEIDPAESRLSVFEGSYSQMKEARQKALLEKKTTAQPTLTAASSRKRSTAEERRRVAEMQRLEEEIHRLETRLRELSARLESPPPDPFEVARLGKEYADLQAELEAKWQTWAAFAETDFAEAS